MPRGGSRSPFHHYTTDDWRRIIEQFQSEPDCIARIAAHLQCGTASVRNQLARHGLAIDRRSLANAKRAIPLPSREELIDLYTKDNLTLVEIAARYCTSNVTVKKWFEEYHIPLLSHRQTIAQKVIPKIRQTNIKRYGNPFFFATAQGQQAVRQTFLKKYGVPFHPIGSTSLSELEILAFCNSLVPGFQKAHVHGIELDGYHPELQLAFEYCGLFWHSETKKGKSLHQRKYRICQAQGIRLITIFEDEWMLRRSQVEGFLRAILRRTEYRLTARTLRVVRVSGRDSTTIEFLNDHHLQGSPNIRQTICHYRLEDEYGTPYAVMSFSRHHRTNTDIVLSRYCVKMNYMIVGGAAKLFATAKKDFDRSILSWSDNRWSDGALYRKLGFDLRRELPKDYSYVSRQRRIAKQQMTKKKMKALAHETEYECAQRLGYDRIWDCGKKLWVWNHDRRSV